MSRLTRRGFSLVELLVVIGIIAVLMGILIPVVIRSRRSAATATCVNNLRQLGALYLMYANANDEWVPLGGLTRVDIPPVAFPPPPRQDWNNFLWVGGFPGSAAGPLMLANLIKPGDTKFLYCPEESRNNLTWEAFRTRLTESSPLPHTTVKIGYAARPEGEWSWILKDDVPIGTGYAMKPLYALDGKALMAEDPGRPPYNHRVGSDPAVNAMYNDGSVETRTLPGPAMSENPLDVEEPIKLPSTAINLGGMAGFLRLDRPH